MDKAMRELEITMEMNMLKTRAMAKTFERIKERLSKLEEETPIRPVEYEDRRYLRRIERLRPGDELHWEYDDEPCIKYLYMGNYTFINMDQPEHPYVHTDIRHAGQDWHVSTDCPKRDE